MKNYLLFAALIFGSTSVMAGSSTYYYFVAYKALIGGKKQCIFEKSISSVKLAGGEVDDYSDKIQKQYVSFLKEKHPEYWKEWVYSKEWGTSPDPDHTIQSRSKLAFHYSTKEAAASAREAEMAYCMNEYKEDPKYYLPVIEVDDEFSIELKRK